MISVLADVASPQPWSTPEAILTVMLFLMACFLFGWAQHAVGTWLLKGREGRVAPFWLVVSVSPILSAILSFGALFLLSAALNASGIVTMQNSWLSIAQLLACGAVGVALPVWMRVWWSARPRAQPP